MLVVHLILVGWWVLRVKKAMVFSLLFTVGMVVRSPQSCVRADHGEDHPLLHGETLRREGCLLEARHHSEAV